MEAIHGKERGMCGTYVAGQGHTTQSIQGH